MQFVTIETATAESIDKALNEAFDVVFARTSTEARQNGTSEGQVVSLVARVARKQEGHQIAGKQA